jgi:hypothetical protein
MFDEKTASVAGKILSTAINHPFLTTAAVGGLVVAPWVASQLYPMAMLKSQLRTNKELNENEEILKRIAENTTAKDGNNNQRKFLTKELL